MGFVKRSASSSIEIISINDEQEESLAKPDIVEVLQDKINILHQSIKNVEKERNDLKIKELSSGLPQSLNYQ